MDIVKKEGNVQITIQRFLCNKILNNLKCCINICLNINQLIIFVTIVLKLDIKSLNVLKELKFKKKTYLNVVFVEMLTVL